MECRGEDLLRCGCWCRLSGFRSIGLSRSACQQLQRTRARSALGNVVDGRALRAASPCPRRRGDSISRGALGRGRGAAVASARQSRGVGARRLRLPRPWAGVRAACSRPCLREDAAAAAPVLLGPGRPAVTMGSILSRRIAGVEDIDIQANSAYRYPPKCGEWRTRAPTAWRELGGRRDGRGAPVRGPPRRGRVGAQVGSRPCLPSSCPELLAPWTRPPGRAWGRGLTSSSRLGDLGSQPRRPERLRSLSAPRGDPRGGGGPDEVSGATPPRA